MIHMHYFYKTPKKRASIHELPRRGVLGNSYPGSCINTLSGGLRRLL